MKRDLIPDPTRYYIKDDPVYTTAYYPELSMIPSRYTRPLYPGIGTITSTKTTPASDVPNIHKYDICVNSEFKTEDELSYHFRRHMTLIIILLISPALLPSLILVLAFANAFVDHFL